MNTSIKIPSGIVLEYSIIHKEKRGKFKTFYFVEFSLYGRINTYIFEKKYSALKQIIKLKNLMN
jgi:hypothetical protein